MMRHRRILAVDDSPIFLEAAMSLLAAVGGIEVVGTANSGHEALERVDDLEPDLVLLDLDMLGMGGLEVARRLAGRPARPRVVIMTIYAEEAYRRAALKAGADGFLRKSELEDRLLPLIRALLPDRGEGEDADDRRHQRT
jgi:DNA-binding NarL/FixJ family response regulator